MLSAAALTGIERQRQQGMFKPTGISNASTTELHGIAAIFQEELNIFRTAFFKELKECFARQNTDLTAALSDVQITVDAASAPREDVPEIIKPIDMPTQPMTYELPTVQPKVLPSRDIGGFCNNVAAVWQPPDRPWQGDDEDADEKKRLVRKESAFVNDDEEDEECEEEGVKLKIDGAFGQIFGSASDNDLQEPHFMVESLYSERGCAQAVARSEIFINISLFVITANAIYLGVDSDQNDAPTLYQSHWAFIFFENAFCAFFTFELLGRFLAFKKKRHCLIDGWFRFDVCLVLMMITETWIMAPLLYYVLDSGIDLPAEPLRLLRLLRLTRMARLMRAMPEMVTMTKGICIGYRAVCSALVMVAVLTYVAAIMLHLMLSEEDEFNKSLKVELARNFATLPNCMWVLLIDGTFMMDGAAVIMTKLVNLGQLKAVVALLVFMFFMLLTALTVMNMLIGVLCRVVTAVSEGEIDDAAIRLMKESILIHLKNYANEKGMISHKELLKVMFNPQSKVVLKQLNVDRLFLMELQKMLFPKPDSEVPIKNVMELMLMCRGDLPASVKSLSSGLSYVSTVLHNFEFRVTENMEILRDIICERNHRSMAAHIGSLHSTLAPALGVASAGVPFEGSPAQVPRQVSERSEMKSEARISEQVPPDPECAPMSCSPSCRSTASRHKL